MPPNPAPMTIASKSASVLDFLARLFMEFSVVTRGMVRRLHYRSSSCRSPMNVIQKVADGHEPFEVFIRNGDTETVFGRDGEIDFGQRVQAQLFQMQVAADWGRVKTHDFSEKFGERRLDFGLLH